MSIDQRNCDTPADNNPYTMITIDVYRELVRQAQQTFNIHLFCIGASIIVVLIGCALPFVGHPLAGVLMTLAGGGTTGLCNQIAKESRHRLENLLREVKQLPYYP